jgi:hypothetical protein
MSHNPLISSNSKLQIPLKIRGDRKELRKAQETEKRGCGFCWVTLEPPLPARQTQSVGAPDGRDGPETDWTVSETRKILGDKAGGAR